MPLQTVLITGCSAGGMGSALAVELQKRNLHVFATARDPVKMAHLERLANITLLNLDPTLPASVDAAVESVRFITGGKLDFLVNNAGKMLVMPILDADIDAAKDLYEINVWGMLRVVQGFASMVIKAKGTIVGISSAGYALNVPWLGLYAGSKAAGVAIHETLRLELEPFDVKVITVVMGRVKTNIFREEDLRLPPSSMYASIEQEIGRNARGKNAGPESLTMDPQTFAGQLASDMLAGASGLVWRGPYSSLVRLIVAWAPKFLTRPMFLRGTGLDVMQKPKAAYYP